MNNTKKYTKIKVKDLKTGDIVYDTCPAEGLFCTPTILKFIKRVSYGSYYKPIVSGTSNYPTNKNNLCIFTESLDDEWWIEVK